MRSSSSNTNYKSPLISDTRQADRIPLIVGVTGHRDPHAGCVERVHSETEDLLIQLYSRYRSTPLVVLSAIAEGCDRIVADVVFALASEGLNIRLVVVTPMPIANYQEDFEGESLT